MSMDDVAAVAFAIVGLLVLYGIVRSAARSGTREALREHEAERVRAAATRHEADARDGQQPPAP